MGTLCGCGGGNNPPEVPQSTTEAALGEKIFNDPSLSASGKLACASCHVVAAGHAQDNTLPAQFGGPALDQQGGRVAPSIRYLAHAGPFRIGSDGRPSGGLFWDGRADTLADQAGRPFLNPVEMALPDKAALATRLAMAPYAAEFQALYGADVLARPEEAFERTTQALARFQLESRDLNSFTSKFDRVRRGEAAFSVAEQRGFSLFTDPRKGNCAACHVASAGADGTPPLFTDFGYHALGVPRNPQLAANADAAHFDLGLCARDRGDLATRRDLCGAFRTPSLRNVALRGALFHNGRFTSLRDAVIFYVQRDTRPELFYGRSADGIVEPYDDLPPELRGNVERRESPYNRKPGEAPALDESEIDDLVAFLHTLTDGWTAWPMSGRFGLHREP